MELSPMRPLHRGAATAAALLLSAYPPNRLTAQRPLQATDYYKLVVVANPALSPDGRRVAFAVTTVVEDKDKRHSEIWMASADGSGKPYRYTSPATEASSPRWSPDGSLLAFTSKREGADDDAWFLRTGAPGGEAFQIAGVHALPVFSPDGRQLLYEWRGPEPDSLKQQPWRERVSPAAITRGPDPKRFDGRLYTSLPVVADERGLVPPRETRRPRHLYVAPLDGGDPAQLTTGEVAQTDPAWSPDGRAVVFVQDSTETVELDVQPRPQLYVLTLADRSVRRLETGYTENASPAWSPDGKWLTYTASDVTRPTELYVAPAAGGRERRVTSFNDAWLAPLAIIPADTFWFAGTGGLRIEGWLMRPSGYQAGKKYPLVLSIHGGPHSNYGNVFFPEFQMLAGQGYWMLFTNPRGSSGYGHAFTFATRGRWGMEDFRDLMQAVDVVIARGEVDTAKLAVLGGSYGGFMTNWIVGHTTRFPGGGNRRPAFYWDSS